MKPKTIKQKVIFNVNPHEVFEALMDSKKHSEFTSSSAKISRKVGGAISAYDDYISGENLELEKDKKIVQKWRAIDWEKDHYSMVTYELKKIKTGTELSFTQTDVPADQYEDINQGWIDHYWIPMKEMLEK